MAKAFENDRAAQAFVLDALPKMLMEIANTVEVERRLRDFFQHQLEHVDRTIRILLLMQTSNEDHLHWIDRALHPFDVWDRMWQRHDTRQSVAPSEVLVLPLRQRKYHIRFRVCFEYMIVTASGWSRHWIDIFAILRFEVYMQVVYDVHHKNIFHVEPLSLVEEKYKCPSVSDHIIIVRGIRC